MNDVLNVKQNIDSTMNRIESARKASSISADKVTLLAASKSQPAGAIEEAISAGITDFGENKVQEAMDKWQTIKQKHPNIKLHLIGHLQTNKVKQALALFDVIQTLDSVRLAESISQALNQTPHSKLQTQFFIQINTGKEPQKHGIFPENADEFINICVNKLKLPVVGLMCIPPESQPPAPHFALLREIAIRNNLKELSMGMSGDYETAIRMGSSCVRIGTGIFGKRNVEEVIS